MYYWQAFYNDGTTLAQHGPDGKVSKYIDIDRTKLARFAIMHGNPKGTARAVVIVNFFRPTQRLIYRRRTGMGVDSGQVQYVVHICGWQELVGGHNQQMVCMVFENDGHIEIMPGFSDKHAIYAPINFLPVEGRD